MELEKELIIQEMISRRDGPIILTASEERFGGYVSNFYLDEDTLREDGIEPSADLVQRILIVRLNSRKPKVGKGGRYFEDLGKNDLLISSIERNEMQYWDIHVYPPAKRDDIKYTAHFKSMGGIPPEERSIDGSIRPHYELKLGINEQEYNKLKELPAHSLMKLSFGLK